MKETSQFQIVLLAVFGFFIIAGVIIFASIKAGGSGDLPPLVMWGVEDQAMMNELISTPIFKQSGLQITYVEKNESTFDKEFTDALAEGRGPDLVLIPQALLYEERNKLGLISYDDLSARDFRDAYIEASEVLLEGNGIRAIPFSIDPLVLYWNRTNFTNANIVSPPSTWDEVSAIAPKLTSKDGAQNIRNSAIALGSYQNITNAKEILATLFLQVGNSITTADNFNNVDTLSSNINNSAEGDVSQALLFYTNFSNPVKSEYTWSRAMPSSRDAFNNSTLSMYIGYASELLDIRRRNPNLNFDVTSMPQLKGGNRATFGKMNVVAVPAQAKNKAASDFAARVFGGVDSLTALLSLNNLPPVHKGLLRDNPSDPYQQIFYESALSSKLWRDPSVSGTNNVFKEMVESVISGRSSVSEAVSVANEQLEDLIK